MSDAPKLLLDHHLKTLKLPTFVREYGKLARQRAAEGSDHVQSSPGWWSSSRSTASAG